MATAPEQDNFDAYEEKLDELNAGLLEAYAAGFSQAVETFERYKDQSLSFTDASTVAVTKEREIDYVLSFDNDFDGLVDRLNPRSING